jgi:hypothetical protein
VYARPPLLDDHRQTFTSDFLRSRDPLLKLCRHLFQPPQDCRIRNKLRGNVDRRSLASRCTLHQYDGVVDEASPFFQQIGGRLCSTRTLRLRAKR